MQLKKHQNILKTQKN